MKMRLERTLRRVAPLFVSLVGIACGNGDFFTDPEDVPAVILVGRAVTANGGPLGATRVTAEWPGVHASSDLGADGSFELALASSPTGQGTLVIEPVGESPQHHPAWIRLEAEAVDQEVQVVLVPRIWHVRQGTHADAEVPISPAAAADPRVLASYWGFTFPFSQVETDQTVTDPTLWSAAPRSWDPAAFPVPLALDRARSTDPWTDADSILVWSAIADLEQALGRDLFQPVPIDAVELDDEPHTGAVLMRFADTLQTRGIAYPALVSDWFLSEDVSAWSGTEVTELRAVGGEITGGVVYIRNAEAAADPALVVHEMMHALGVGHGCSWPSVQTYCEALEASLPTAEDVAYLEVLEAVRVAERQLGTRHGILSAVFGERVVELGQAPMPSADLVGSGPQ